MSLKLEKLPDRDPVKITFTANPELKSALNDYAELYSCAYGQKESVTDLIPFMLDTFMNADQGFKRSRKQLHEARALPPPRQSSTIQTKEK
ncbi:DUF2274 domain-containing protein [Hoeflea poritis]|uniref:DUF2274 domain-containing protein n=1 Tax=Hoeflea poritis TaxID=2993659 RepID=A0ABT4VWM0_9HYPH|nr:DUF2274 domain-containing protein [Hoeflea poritis]MDA4848610.1 DUF2274 domain-containing protein [Hoeflea poritis]